ncbi:uncharacterized protein LOC126549394 [Aphis gossypii]|uniref:uncharacterized protein LOC126549394 n=1 Tax=Aphis gossypii TaxID=80765 RepID=UPI0021591EC2|nr:uncharacterized protein LOC126549394 [Aphis gossypii]
MLKTICLKPGKRDDSLNRIGYKSTFVLPNFFEFTNRIIFVNGGIEKFKQFIIKKYEKCLSEKSVPDDARACLKLNDAQKCLFKESDNNWAYRYECDMLYKIYERELPNATKWCTQFAVQVTPKEFIIEKYHEEIRAEDLARLTIKSNDKYP